jgi:hypothetical protein
LCKVDHAFHDRGEAGNGAGAQIVAIRKATGQDDAIIGCELREVFVLVPEHRALLAQVVHQGIINIPVAIGAGENNYTKFHNGKDSLKSSRSVRKEVPKRGMNFLCGKAFATGVFKLKFFGEKPSSFGKNLFERQLHGK